MNSHHNHYQTVASAISYIRENRIIQPSLEEIARHVNLSPWHFQKLFTEWAGVSPKKFLQYTTLNHAKKLIRQQEATLFDAAFETGLSGTGRLHDLFISVEAMTPGEYKNGGAGLTINYSVSETRFGRLLIASTQKGICTAGFLDGQIENGVNQLRKIYPNAQISEEVKPVHEKAREIINNPDYEPGRITLHLRGTEFQLNVWQALLKIPEGALKTYQQMASSIENDKAARAVGSAIGKNPVAMLIPCHRVIRSDGETGGYMWGEIRKRTIIGWEAAQRK